MERLSWKFGGRTRDTGGVGWHHCEGPPCVGVTAWTGTHQSQNQLGEERGTLESLAQGSRPRLEGLECPDFFQEQMEAAAVQVMEQRFCLFLDFLGLRSMIPSSHLGGSRRRSLLE